MTTPSAADYQAALASGSRVLGALVYWGGLSAVHVARPAWRHGLRVAGLGRALQRDPRPEKSLRAAANVASRAQPKGADRARIETKGKTDQTSTVAVLMRRDVSDAAGERRRYVEEARITVDRFAPSAVPMVAVSPGVVADAQRDELVASVLAHYDDVRNYVTTAEASTTLLHAMDQLGALGVRAGVYFVPASAIDTVRLLKTFVETATGASITVWEIAASDENAETSKRDANVAFRDQLQAIVTECKLYTQDLKLTDVNHKSLNARVKHFRELDAKVSLYADILGEHVGNLHAAIAAAKHSLLGAYLGAEDDQLSAIPSATDEAA